MLTVNVRVPADRERTAVLEIISGSAMIASSIACATADVELAKRHGNAACDAMRPWGHAPLGRYRLLASGKAPAGSEIEYGKDLLVFQPESGAALEAESFGRLLLLVYAGPAAQGGQLRRTQGGLRLAQKAFDVLLGRTATESDVLLQIGTLHPPAWWQFWKRAGQGFPVATGSPKFSVPPLDEISLAAALSAGKRLARRTPPQRSDDDFGSRRDSDSASGSTSREDGTYAGRGGEFGGGGASGSWDAPASSGAGRGVDSAGRITAAAAGVAAAAVVAQTLAAAERDGASPDAGTDTSTDAATNY